MAFKKLDGFFKVGDVLSFESFGSRYGVKVLTFVSVPGLNEGRYILQCGSFNNEGEFVANSDGQDLSLGTAELIKADYPDIWFEEKIKDGDVLVSENYKHVFIVKGIYNEEPCLQRVSPSTYGIDQGFDRLSYYEREYGPLTMLKTYGPDRKRFSA
jgi:hypothetical protein